MKTASHARRGAVLFLGLVALTALTVRMVNPPRPIPGTNGAASASTGKGAPGAAARVRWPEGRRYRYALDWTAKTASEIAPGGAAGAKAAPQQLQLESSIGGEIALQGMGAGEGDAQQVALDFVRVDRFSLSINGKESGGAADKLSAALAGQTAMLTVDARGRIGAIAFPEDIDPGVAGALRSLALELGYSLPDSADVSAWEADEPCPLGQARVRYRRGADGELVREVVEYSKLDANGSEPLDGEQSLRGGATLSLDADGTPAQLGESSAVSYARRTESSPGFAASAELVLKRLGELPPRPAPAKLRAPQALTAQVEDAKRAAREDARRAEGVKIETLLLAVEQFEKGTRPGHELIVKGGSFLRLHPEMLPQLVAQFESPSLSKKGRGLLLDLMAETGTHAAQGAMREALSSPAALASPKDRSALLQRFSFLFAPDSDSIAYLTQVWKQSRGVQAQAEVEASAAMAMGAMVRRLSAQRGLSADAAALAAASAASLDAQLREALAQARTPEAEKPLIAALGNAARPEDLTPLVAHARDEDDSIRDQVAHSLRGIDSPRARESLLELAADRSPVVAATAFGALKQQPLGEADWRALDDEVAAGRTPPAADGTLLELLGEKGAGHEQARSILLVVQKRNPSPDSDVATVADSLLHGPLAGN